MAIPNKIGIYLQKSKLYPFIRKCYRRTLRRILPTKQMVIDRYYYENNREIFKKVLSILDDELSKRNYQTVIYNRIQRRGEKELHAKSHKTSRNSIFLQI